MTDILCYNDSYLQDFEAIVTDVVGTGIVLDKTVFYPGGGGQPCDTGTIKWDGGSTEISKVSRVDGKLVHKVEDSMPDVGESITGVIDWDKRYQLMRTHTALHILCGVVWRDYAAQVTGGNMTPLQARMDFELSEMSSGFASEIENLVNQEVQAERDIKVFNLSREEAFKIPDLIRMKINKLPDSISEVRIVDISGLDLQADGGTHVHNTREVGNIRVIGHESKGRINKRLRIAVED
ncbi:MAG: alanyl-tRNA editing protein [SAR202 cluster bacterium]|nr:MAG: alanyl-tRNA editing protein [SAR202 cluster bacterium]KAA1302611.1 MAG: alanyl-tRNA editing protein [SAR202 cluster bacterium]PKB60852.1 MAG: Ala-tRNA(Pro) hydrolase [SAR202 cluster bacterium Ae2-Chloro-G2]|tara:strand:- start:722 stop:1432 length:711 start_codon:yes stop_codon:yes gene_type:complete